MSHLFVRAQHEGLPPNHRALEAVTGGTIGADWRFTVRDGYFHHPSAGPDAAPVVVLELAPVRAFGFRKGKEYNQTRWTF